MPHFHIQITTTLRLLHPICPPSSSSSPHHHPLNIILILLLLPPSLHFLQVPTDATDATDSTDPTVLTIPTHVLPSSSSSQILIGLDIEVGAAILRAHNRQYNSVQVHTAHEDGNNKPIVVPRLVPVRWQRESLTQRRLDGRTSRRCQIAQLITGAHHKRPEAAGAKFHQVNGNHAPRTLDAELLEKRSGNDALVGHKGVGVQDGASEHAHDDDAEPTADDGGCVAHDGAAGHGAEVGDDLGDGDGVGGEVVLAGEHGGVEILGAVGHEVEACHMH
jgi:hypothetical protein